MMSRISDSILRLKKFIFSRGVAVTSPRSGTGAAKRGLPGLFGTGVRSHGRRAFAHNSLGKRSNPKQEKDPPGDGERFCSAQA